MFEFTLSPWELVGRAVVIYVALLAMVRLSGKRTVGQFTPFDLLVVMLLSEAVSNALSAGDESVSAGLLVAGTLVVLNALTGFASSRSRLVEQMVDGRPVLIGREGKVFDDLLKRHRLAQSDFEQALREADCTLEDMRCAFLEADGSISILQKKK